MNRKRSFSVQDYIVSGEEFQMEYNSDFDMYYTKPRPDKISLPKYYQSEDYISHTDASHTLTDRLYQMVKKFMLDYKFRIISKYNKRGNLLDIGAGTGDFCAEAEKKGYTVNGIEPNQQARERAKQKNINLETDISKIHSSFEVITLWHVLEHVENLEDYFKFLKEHLTNSGTLFIAVPNFKSADAQFYKEYWAAYDVPRHLYHFSKYSISKLAENHGLQLIETKPLWFDSFYVSILSEKYKKSKMGFVRGILTGLKSNLAAIQTKEYSSQIYVLKHQNI